MSINTKDVTKLANLARIKEPADELAANSIVKDLNNILKMVDIIKDINTNDILPMAHPLDFSQRLRLDQVSEDNVKKTMQNIPVLSDKDSGLYLVPKVVE